MNRRRLLQSFAALPLATCAARLYAAPAAPARVLLVFLRGGYDAANLLVPISSPFYYQSRPNIAIPRPGAGTLAALPLSADWGLHPALRATIQPLYERNEAAFIPFAGSDDATRSHFETQDALELGQPLTTGHKDYRSGFLNRLAGAVSGAAPIAFTDHLPIAMQGPIEVPNMALRGLLKPAVDLRQSQVITAMYTGTALCGPVSKGFAVRDEVSRDLAAEMAAASRNASTTKGFELEARRIARVMKDKFTLGFVDVGGWDTHVGEGGAAGYLANRFDELGRGLAAYVDEMGPLWHDTVVIVMSEFGRTFRENGNRGTDHGHGTVYWVLGGAIRGGRIAGEQQRVDASTLFQDRDYPVLNEYRAILGGLFARLYGMAPAQLERVFPGVRPRDVGLI